MISKQEAEVGRNQDEETVEECIARVKAENPELSDEAARAKCTNKPVEKEDEHQCGPDKVWDPNANEGKGGCVAKPPEAAKGLRDQILAVMTEYGEKLSKDIRTGIEERMKVVVKETRDEMVTSLRKGLGLEHDPVVHISEIEGEVRKILLKEQPHGKKTETTISDKPTEGAPDELGKKIVKPAEQIFNDLRKNKTGI